MYTSQIYLWFLASNSGILKLLGYKNWTDVVLYVLFSDTTALNFYNKLLPDFALILT